MEFNCENCGKTGYGSAGSGPVTSGIPPKGWKWNKSFGFGRKIFCSNRCLDEFNNRNSVKNEDVQEVNHNQGANQSHAEAAKINAQAEKIRAKIEAEKAEAEADRIYDENIRLEKEKLESKIHEIASLDFGNSKEDIYNVLDRLIVIGNSKPSPKERKAIFDKMEIGIMKLKKMGESDCSFYEDKMLKIKPTIWQKIGYYFANN